jgi:hypothetical protein
MSLGIIGISAGQAREERDTIVDELERYGKEIPSFKRIKELETELDKAKKLNEHYETSNRGLTKELADARREAASLEDDGLLIPCQMERYCKSAVYMPR